jgi:hypothetical protein
VAAKYCKAVVQSTRLNYRKRLNPVMQLFDLPARLQSLKVQAGIRQCGDEVDGLGTRTRP